MVLTDQFQVTVQQRIENDPEFRLCLLTRSRKSNSSLTKSSPRAKKSRVG